MKRYMLGAIAFFAFAQVVNGQTVTIQGTVNTADGKTGSFGPVTTPLQIQQPPIEPPIEPPPTQGAGQYPDLLKGYMTRPPWMVAGVDYPVGLPSGTALNSPMTLSGNSNISVNSGSHQVAARGSNYTITNIDFSEGGGWQLILYGSNITVTKSNFAIGPNRQAMVNGNVGGSNNTITYSTFNGNGLTDNYNNANVYVNGGTTRVEYCYLENASADLYNAGGSGSSVQNIILKYNLLVNAGQASGSHPDWVQLGGGTYTVDVEYNTFYQTAATVGPGTQGIFVDSNNNNAKLVGANVVSNNTLVMLAGSRVNFAIAALAVAGASNTFSIANNYMDPTGINNAVYKYTSSQNTQTGNMNMVSGAPLDR
jgi:hypothetical protein